MIGKQVLNYKIDTLLGEGGMGSVYLATHLQLGRKVAIKALNPSLVKNPSIRARFKNEAATLSSLHHPNIVILFDYLEEEDALYLIMEYVDGKPLDEYIETVSGPIPEEKAKPLFTQVLDGFAYAHEQGVIHRDVKPGNIMITARERVKILDFGIAKLLSRNENKLTQTGTKMGTVLYMSPEQVKGDPVDKRSDIYSLGVTLFQMLTGRGPYEEATATEFVIYNKIVNEPLPLARSFYPGVSDQMQAVIDKATAKNPDQRFQSCTEFRQALMGSISLNNISFTAKSNHNSTEKVSYPSGTANPAKKIGEPEKTEKKKSSSGLNLLIGLIIAAIIISGIIYLNRTTESSSSEKQVEIGSPSKEAENKPTVSEREEANEPETVSSPENVAVESETETDTVNEQSLTNTVADIRLVYEIVEESETDTNQAYDNRLTVRIVLTNDSPDVSYDNVTIRISYFDSSDQLIGRYIYEHGLLEAGVTERFLIERKVRASRIECSIASADPVQKVIE